MAFQFEQTGSINLTNGSKNVTGTGTNWATGYAGIVLNIAGLSYPVETLNSINSLTLVDPYAGPTASGVTYTFIPAQPENYGLVVTVNELLSQVTELIEVGSSEAVIADLQEVQNQYTELAERVEESMLNNAANLIATQAMIVSRLAFQ